MKAREHFLKTASKSELLEWAKFSGELGFVIDESRFNPGTAGELNAILDEAFPWSVETSPTDAARAEEREAIAAYIELGSANLGSAQVSESQTAFYSGMMDELAQHIREGLHLPESDRPTP